MEAILDAGAMVIGGCCGTTPDHIAALRALIDARPLPAVASVSVPAHAPVASSATAVSAGPASSRAVWGEQSEPKDLPAPSIPNPLYRPAFTVTSAQQMVSLPEGEARIENIAANPMDQKVVITLKDSGETVYESAAIAPDQHIQTIKLTKDLDPGQYAAVATFTGYDRETHKQTGQAAAEIVLNVEG